MAPGKSTPVHAMRQRILAHLLLWSLLVAGWGAVQRAAGVEEARWAAAEEDFDALGRRVWFDLEIALATPLVDGGSPCSLGPHERLRLGRRLLRGGEGAAREATCVYHAELRGRGPECLIEFPGTGAGGYATGNAGASLADRYYHRTQGGIAYLSPAAAGGAAGARTFLILDDRWCRWLGAGTGFRLRS